jgi:uncharacterized protein (TIGR02246 family)
VHTSLELARALTAGDLSLAASQFTREACFATPDATVVRGRDEIRAILAQLIARQCSVAVADRSVMVTGEVALGSERWTIRSRGTGETPFVQTSKALWVCRRSEGAWKLAIAAPWGGGA